MIDLGSGTGVFGISVAVLFGCDATLVEIDGDLCSHARAFHRLAELSCRLNNRKFPDINVVHSSFLDNAVLPHFAQANLFVSRLSREALEAYLTEVADCGQFALRILA
jgi:predicted RNA methylase